MTTKYILERKKGIESKYEFFFEFWLEYMLMLFNDIYERIIVWT